MGLKNIISIMILFTIVSSISYANEIDKTKLPNVLGASSSGTEFYFSFIPSWESSGLNNDLKIFITSKVKTKVKLEIPGKNYSEEKFTIPNDIIEFKLDTKTGLPCQMVPWKKPGNDTIYVGAGVHIKSEHPINCYAVTKFAYNAEGFLVLPVNVLGKEYIVSSFADVASNKGQWLPSLTSITGVMDNTEVKFTLGGNPMTTTVSGLLPGEHSTWTLNKGDVLLISSLGTKAELTGSKVEASNPVAVVSGNFCTYVPTECGCCDLTEEMEMPTNLWGTKYHVTPIYGRKKSSIIKIFAKEENTTIYRDYLPIGEIKTAGGIDFTGYIPMRADTGQPRPIVISGNKPISVTQYNSSHMDDAVASDPFQMVLVPTELYQKEMTFHTPDLVDSNKFTDKYINICYQTNGNEQIPQDLEFAKCENGDFQWKKVALIDSGRCKPFAKNGTDNYYYTSIKLDKGGVYKLKGNLPFQAYAYGFSWCDSYGFPAFIGEPNNTVVEKVDNLPPVADYNLADDWECTGIVNGTLRDVSESEENFSEIMYFNLIDSLSYNYKLETDKIVPCNTRSINWSLNKIKANEDAVAVMKFQDCESNFDTISFKHYLNNHLVTGKSKISLVSKSNETVEHIIDFKNNSAEHSSAIEVIKFKSSGNLTSDNNGFWLTDMDGNKITSLPLIVPAGKDLKLKLFFKRIYGTVTDSLGFGDNCFFEYQKYINAQAKTGIISVKNLSFPETNIGIKFEQQLDVENKGNDELIITDIIFPKTTGVLGANQYLIFESEALRKLQISTANPLRLNPGAKRSFMVIFQPDMEKNYTDSIVFISNTGLVDGIMDMLCLLTGRGNDPTAVLEIIDNNINIFPNPTKDILNIENLPDNCTKITIIDESGKSVREIDLKNADANQKISTKDLSQGLYILRINLGNKIIDKKVIIER